MFKKIGIGMGLLVITQFYESVALDCHCCCDRQKENKVPCFEVTAGKERYCCPKSQVKPPVEVDQKRLVDFTCPTGEELKGIIKPERNLRDGEQYFFKKGELRLSYLYKPILGENFTKVPFEWGRFNVSIKLDKIRYTTVPKPNSFYEIICNYDCENEKGQKTTLIVSSEFTRINIKTFGEPIRLNGAQDKQDPEGHWYSSVNKNPGDVVFKLSAPISGENIGF